MRRISALWLCLLIFGFAVARTQGAVNTWSALNLTGGDIQAISINVLAPNKVYAYAVGPGFFESGDKGKTWNFAQQHFTPPATIVAAGGFLYRTPGIAGSVEKSIDGGITWVDSSNGLPSGGIKQLVALDANLYAVVASPQKYGVFKSADGGATWTNSGHGLTDTFPDYSVQFLAVVNDTIYAVVTSFCCSPNLFLSPDGGVTWNQTNTDLTTASSIYSLVGNSDTLYLGTGIGVFTSTDGGANWTFSSSGLATIPPPGAGDYVFSVVLIGSTAYASTYGSGIFKSIDGGASWTAANSGLTDYYINTLVTDGMMLYAGTDRDGIFISSDGGNSWHASNSGLLGRVIDAVAVSPAGIFADSGVDGLYVSMDNGNTWSMRHTLPGATAFLDTGTTLIAAGSHFFTSKDGGLAWLPSSDDIPNLSPASFTIRSFAIIGSTIYAGATETVQYGATSGFVLKSTDDGKTWTTVPRNNSGILFGNISIAALNSTLFAGTDSGIYKSTDGGITWNVITNDITAGIISLAVSGGTLFAGANGGLYRSTDGGAHWQESDSGLGIGTDKPAVTSFVVNKGTLYAGSYDGVFYSLDGGTQWTVLDASHSPRLVSSLVFDGKTLYAGSLGGGVYVMTIVMPPSIDNATPPNAVVGKPYNFTYSATGTTPISYRLAEGALPPGLTLSASGVISGIPSKAGNYSWTVVAENEASPSNPQAVTISITDSGGGGEVGVSFFSLLLIGLLARRTKA